MSLGGRARSAALIALALSGAMAPALAQTERVPQSLWGVRADVGLGVVPQFVTNYGDRAFFEARPSGEGVRVAVIDTGIEPDHPDIEGSMACGECWRDFVDNRSQPYDNNGHGTHVAGIITGDGHLQPNPLNSYFPTGAIGLAPEAELIVAKAMNESGAGKDGRVAEAIRWAMDPDGRPNSGDEPHILHLSLGVTSSGSPDETVRTGSKTEKAVQDAIERGIFVVMSAGNQGEQGPAIPGNVDGVIAVGGLTSDGGILPSSNRGAGVDVFAPGVVTSTWPRSLDTDRIEDGYTGLAGTSQAAPILTGGLALAIEANPELTAASATKVEHVESMVRETGNERSTESGRVVAFDGARFVASQDQGTDEFHWGIVAGVALVVLLVVITLGRIGLAALREYEETNDLAGEPPAQNPSPDSGDSETEFSEGTAGRSKP